MSDKPDMSALFSMLANANGAQKEIPQDLLSNLINTFHSTQTENTTENASEGNHVNSSANIPDMEMMMKLMQILKASNQENPSKDLLQSLKPFLNDSRKEKVDQYIRMIGMTKALETLNELGDQPK